MIERFSTRSFTVRNDFQGSEVMLFRSKECGSAVQGLGLLQFVEPVLDEAAGFDDFVFSVGLAVESLEVEGPQGADAAGDQAELAKQRKSAQKGHDGECRVRGKKAEGNQPEVPSAAPPDWRAAEHIQKLFNILKLKHYQTRPRLPSC